MGTLQVQQISLAYGERLLLDNISFTLPPLSKVALTGGNGSGKSTLLQIINRTIFADSGSVLLSPSLRVSYLPQSGIFHSGTTLYREVERGFERYKPLLQRVQEVEHLLKEIEEGEKHTHLLEELYTLQESLYNSSYYQREAIIDQVLKGLGFSKEDKERQCDQFSGGWHMRIALAKLLVERADIALLDEPTNYLDIEARIWLRNYLKQFKGSYIIVSHDQDFLDQTVEHVYEIRNGKLNHYKGNYSSFLTQREQLNEQIEKAYRQQQKEIEKIERFIERFRSTDSKARQVQSRVKHLEKLERITLPSTTKTLSFSFKPPIQSGNDVLYIEEVDKAYGEHTIFRDLSFMVTKGDKLAVTGKNGAGKSTLLRLLSQVDTDYSGSIRLGSNVKIGYFAQDTEKSLQGENSLLEEVESVANSGDYPNLRSLLGSFLFSDDDVDKKVSVLSGGERSRLALLKILLHPVNLLILDEPTNHLDIPSMQILLKALQEYKGTIVFVSHDTHFIEHLATRILYLNENEIEFFEGDYHHFAEKLEEKEVFVDVLKEKRAPQRSHLSYKEANRLRNRLQTLTQNSSDVLNQLTIIEAQIEQIIEQMGLKENYSDGKIITSLIKKREELERQYAIEENRWFTLESEKEALDEILI